MHGIKVRNLSATFLPLLLLGLAPSISASQSGATHILPAPRHLLLVYGNLVHNPVGISASTIRVMPQVKAKVVSDPGKKAVTYSGVSLAELLGQAGVSVDDLSAKNVSFALTATGGGGQHVVLSSSKASPLLHGNQQVIVADAINGKPLPASAGPLELIVATDKDSSRRVPNLTRIRIDSAQ